MGSYIETNDTLQITKEQGFPSELNFDRHKEKPLVAKDFEGTIFKFNNKPGKRIFHSPPVRTFLVENIDGKWLYWGLIHILETTYDAEKDATSGKFKIIYIYTPEEMKKAYELIDRNVKTKFFT